MYRPNISYSDSSSSSGLDSESGSESDGQMDAITAWQNAARSAFRDVRTTTEHFPPVGDDVAATPEATENGVALFNTRIAFEEKRRTHVIMVNSLDRDQSVYPLPTQLRLKLPRLYKNVERIDIVQVKFFCGL